MTIKVLALSAFSVGMITACSVMPAHFDNSGTRTPADAQQTSTPRVVQVKMCPAATFGPLASLILVPTDLQATPGRAMALDSSSVFVQNGNLIWNGANIGTIPSPTTDSNGCVWGNVTLNDNIQLSFSQNVDMSHKLLCENAGGVLPHPTGPCDVKTVTLSLSINGQNVKSCTSVTELQSNAEISSSGDCASI